MNTEQLAEELHCLYRAAFKALHKEGDTRQVHCAGGHDHGYAHCSRKDYFYRRARLLTTTMENYKAQEEEGEENDWAAEEALREAETSRLLGGS